MADVNYIDWHVHPFRADRWLEIWRPALDRAVALGASSCYLTRDVDDPLHFRQISVWERRSDFEHYWYSPEVAALREAALNYFNKPILPYWASLTAEAAVGEPPAESRATAVEAAP